MVDDDALSDSTKGGMAVEVVESVWDIDSSVKLQGGLLNWLDELGRD